MTLTEAYQKGKKILTEAELESPAFDAISLFRQVFGLDRQALIMRGGETAAENLVSRFLDVVKQRAQGRPLQYILGCWPFMDMELDVGEGVLIPREETEQLVYTAARRIADAFPVSAEGAGMTAVDLCAGTGAVSLGLAGLLPRMEIFALELEERAFRYLLRNVQQTGRFVKPLQRDICQRSSAQPFPLLHAILSNPPYIPSGELHTLQREVQWEPVSALDGGSDGMSFYRCIAEIWIPCLTDHGVCAVEIGEDQGDQVASLFIKAGLKDVCVEKDFNGLDRVVSGIRY